MNVVKTFVAILSVELNHTTQERHANNTKITRWLKSVDFAKQNYLSPQSLWNQHLKRCVGLKTAKKE
jgi:hypothetical protein